jgi:adenosine 3'-phospho 5'-phosphosulfate transporter B3
MHTPHIRWVALGSVTYPTVLLFKSSKIIVVMISAVVILRKRFLLAEYAAALLAVIGLYTFSRADRIKTPQAGDEEDSLHGVFVILMAVGAEALVSTLQEYCLRKLNRSLSEVLFFTNGLGAVMLSTVSILHGDAKELHARLAASSDLFLWVLATVTLAYGGTYAFTSCIQGFGAIVATGLGILRKLLSVVLSFILFPKPFGVSHAAGLAVFFSGLVVAWSADWEKSRGAESHRPNETNSGGSSVDTSEDEDVKSLLGSGASSKQVAMSKTTNEAKKSDGVLTVHGPVDVPLGPGM